MKKKLGLIFPHQLFNNHPILEITDVQYLVEEDLILGGDSQWHLRPHAKKLIMHLASLRYFTDTFHVTRIKSYADIELTDIGEIIVCRLVDDLLGRRLAAFCEENQIVFTEIETPGFVTPSEWGKAFFDTNKKPFMKTFYEAQRKRMNILIDDDGSPTGGRWSYDDENRKKFPARAEPPADPVYQHAEDEKRWINEAKKEIDEGRREVFSDYEDFRYPVSHAGARVWLEEFLEHRFSHFGTYEDAITRRSIFLFHSALTPMLNIGLLNPTEVVKRALEVGQKNGVEINHIEGFVRQVIGWREYMSIMYEKHGRYLRTQNFWQFQDSMPSAIYKWKTGLPPVDDVLEKVKREGYAHHIERLMIMGNFFMLLRIKPTDVFQWFSEMFIDAYDWVMVPNVYGMSQFSDGGLLVTKPYISGSNYIRKMSDYKAGDWCEVWDALFWSFIDDHRDYFSKQYRMKMMVSHLAKMGGEKLAKHHELAAKYREALQLGGCLDNDLIKQITR